MFLYMYILTYVRMCVCYEFTCIHTYVCMNEMIEIIIM